MTFKRSAQLLTSALVLSGLALATVTAFSNAWAQTLGVALTYERLADGVLEPELQVRDVALAGLLVDLRLGDGLTGPLELGGAARFRSSFGPLGTVSARAHADVSTHGAFDVGVDGSGALAATGLTAELSVANRNPGSFAGTAAYALESRPFYPPNAGTGVQLQVGATQRLGRTLLLTATPSLGYLIGNGVGGEVSSGVSVGLDTRLQLRRLFGEDNALVLFEGWSGPGDARTFVAGGAEYQLNRRDWPSLNAALLLGSGNDGLLPGFRGGVAGEFGGFSYRAELAAEPYRENAPPYRANLALGRALGPGAVGLEFGGTLANDFGVPPALVRSSYAFRF